MLDLLMTVIGLLLVAGAAVAVAALRAPRKPKELPDPEAERDVMRRDRRG